MHRDVHFVRVLVNKVVKLISNNIYLKFVYLCRAIVAGDHKFVFLVKGHLILVAISYAKESEAQVILSTLHINTGPINWIWQTYPIYSY
jgi:hypothetical protein